MLNQNVVEPAQQKWTEPIVYEPKKEKPFFFYVCYRNPNAITKHDAYFISRMDQCINSLGEGAISSTLNANSGYWQIDIEESHWKNHTYVTPRTVLLHSHPIRNLECPCNLPERYERYLATITCHRALVYLDYIVIFPKTLEKHICLIREDLSLPNNTDVTMNLRKCQFSPKPLTT